MPTWTTIISWLIIGALAGSLTSNIMGRAKRGHSRLSNLGVGLIGALIGGAIFQLFNVDLALGQISVSLQDLLAALLGSLLFLGGLRLYKTRKA
jgi:uncharacterized membrane protein YeaQ/YmgE (transglycosylase-associated protein family)